jgi:hypothetical protein
MPLSNDVPDDRANTSMNSQTFQLPPSLPTHGGGGSLAQWHYPASLRRPAAEERDYHLHLKIHLISVQTLAPRVKSVCSSANATSAMAFQPLDSDCSLIASGIIQLPDSAAIHAACAEVKDDETYDDEYDAEKARDREVAVVSCY